MKTIAAAKNYDSSDKRLKIDFRDGSAFERAAKFLLAKFNMSLKNDKTPKVKKEKTEENSEKDEVENSTTNESTANKPPKKKKRKKSL